MLRVHEVSAFVVSLLGVIAMPALGGAADSTDQGILVMAHGGDAAWNKAVEEAVSPLREKYPVEIAFGMARTSTLRDSVQRLEKRGVRRIAVVRMFISGDSFLQQTEYILGLRKELRGGGSAGHGHHMETPEQIAAEASFVLSDQGVGEAPLVDQILYDRVKALSTDPSRESVLILAHGPADEAENERWLANMRLRAQRIHELGPFRHVQCETLREDWPQRRREAQRRIRAYVQAAKRDGGRCIVVPFRVGGFGPYEEVLEGLDYVADKRGFCPHPNMTAWIEKTAHKCFAGQ